MSTTSMFSWRNKKNISIGWNKHLISSYVVYTICHSSSSFFYIYIAGSRMDIQIFWTSMVRN